MFEIKSVTGGGELHAGKGCNGDDNINSVN